MPQIWNCFGCSKNGFDWPNPIKISNKKTEDSKYSATYFCITKDAQLIISFQTDEYDITSGFKGDLYPIMKVLISKSGIPIEKINKNTSYAITNIKKSPIGGSNLRSGMMVLGHKIFTCSSGHPILFSEIQLYADPDDYNNLLKEKYLIKIGSIIFKGKIMIITNQNTLIMKKDLFLLDKVYTFYSFIIPNIDGDCRIILPLDKNKNFDITKKLFNIFWF